MTFNSLEFFVFLPTVVGLYWALPQRPRLWLLLVASYVFYGWWDARFLGLLALSTVVDFTISRAIHRSEDERRRLALLWTSAAVNLGILGTFKYANFFIASANQAFERLGLGGVDRTLAIVLPVGISFYTFQTMSYTFDVYRRRIEPTDDLVTFGVYVAFFPQLVAGPIERAHHLLPQFQRPAVPPTQTEVRSALGAHIPRHRQEGRHRRLARAGRGVRIREGGYRRMGVAARRGLRLRASDLRRLLGVHGRGSRCRRGCSAIDLMRNFEQPYLSRSITEFWRRWHISLSTWLRDYLYVPLGGNRGRPLTTARNLMLTMVLGGLWHGAAWTFVAWGTLHGVFLAVERPFRHRSRAGDERPLSWHDLPAVLVTFHLVCLAWIFFRATGFANAWDVLAGLVSLRPGPIDVGDVAWLVVVALAVLALDLAQHRSREHSVVLHLPAIPRGLVYGVASVALLVFSGGTPVPFLYFQF